MDRSLSIRQTVLSNLRDPRMDKFCRGIMHALRRRLCIPFAVDRLAKTGGGRGGVGASLQGWPHIWTHCQQRGRRQSQREDDREHHVTRTGAQAFRRRTPLLNGVNANRMRSTTVYSLIILGYVRERVSGSWFNRGPGVRRCRRRFDSPSVESRAYGVQIHLAVSLQSRHILCAKASK